MRRLARRLTALVTGLALAGALSLTAGVTTAGPASAATGTRMLDRFAREVVRPGDTDTDPWHIEHVYELQWRLSRVGLYEGYPTGHFGSRTRHAVKRFKRRVGLASTAVMGQRAWTALIKRSTRGRAMIPDACRSTGWHACYDRKHHQLTLFHDGLMYNSWMVRGGASYSQTRIGDFVVGYRDIDHRSSKYDDAAMPYSQFFDGDRALHGSRYMVDPYEGHSHGCVNLYVEDARRLWQLTYDKRLSVHVYGAWD